jgi:hypothetical protein
MCRLYRWQVRVLAATYSVIEFDAVEYSLVSPDEKRLFGGPKPYHNTCV